jgi:hypothetical protein
MKKALAILVLMLFIGAGVNKYVPSSFSSIVVLTGTFARAQVDTVFYARPPGLVGLAFSAHFKDSLKVQVVVAGRIIGGELMTLATADTLAPFTGFKDTSSSAMGVQGSTGNPSSALSATVTLTALPDVFRFIIKYDTTNVVRNAANTADSIATMGLTNPKVDYIIQQQFYK